MEASDARVLAEMRAYYGERAREYDDWFYRRGRYDRGREATERWFAEVDTMRRALERSGVGGRIVELACGTGIWTEQLAGLGSSVTAIDASAEMLEVNRSKLQDPRVSYVQADLFGWSPAECYDAAFAGFWLSHVPVDRLDAFLASVARALRPGGTFFFVDSRREPTSTASDHRLPEPESPIASRRLNDGREFQIVKIFYEPGELEQALERTGFSARVAATPSYFIHGRAERC